MLIIEVEQGLAVLGGKLRKIPLEQCRVLNIHNSVAVYVAREHCGLRRLAVGNDNGGILRERVVLRIYFFAFNGDVLRIGRSGFIAQ